jgi:hypothetical protein
VSHLEYFDQEMSKFANLRIQARRLHTDADRGARELLESLDLVCEYRGPGEPCWRLRTKNGWYNTPRDALVAKEGT